MSHIAYRDAVMAMLAEVSNKEGPKIERAAKWCAESLVRGGLIHVFGTGHSHMLAEEMFYRAGGLLPVNPIFDVDLMIHVDAPKSSRMERMTGLAEVLLIGEPVKRGDVLLVFSNSGRNAVPIEMALAARDRGMKVIGITSLAHSLSVSSRHPSNKKLFEVVDLAIDNHGVPGDGVVAIPGLPVKAAPTSTVIGSFIVEAIVAEIASRMDEQGIRPPITLSGNIDGAEQYNAQMLEKYKERLKDTRIRR